MPLPRPEETKRFGKVVAAHGSAVIAVVFIAYLFTGADIPTLAGLLFTGYFTGGYLLALGGLTVIYRPYTAFAFRMPIFGFFVSVGVIVLAGYGLGDAFTYTGRLRAGISVLAVISLVGAVVLFWDSRLIYRAMDRAESGLPGTYPSGDAKDQDRQR